MSNFGYADLMNKHVQLECRLRIEKEKCRRYEIALGTIADHTNTPKNKYDESLYWWCVDIAKEALEQSDE